MADEIFGGVSNAPPTNPEHINPRWREQLSGNDLQRASERQRAEDSNAHQLEQIAKQAKFAPKLERFYRLRSRWRVFCATASEVGDRYRAARDRLASLEGSHPHRMKSYRDSGLPAPVAEIHAIEQARELVAVLKLEHEQSNARARSAGDVVSNLTNYLAAAGAKIEEDR